MPVYLGATTATSGDAAWTSTAGLGFNPANTLIVAESGGQYTAIETALAAATAGQTVLVFPGTYTAPLAGYSVPANVTLRGISRDEVILNGVTGAPTNTVTLGAEAALAEVEILQRDVLNAVGVLMSGASSKVYGIRVGSATAANANIGISVTAADVEIRDVTYYTAMATGLKIGVAGTGTAFSLDAQGTVVGKAATPFIDCAGGTFKVNGAELSTITLTSGVSCTAGGILRCVGVFCTNGFTSSGTLIDLRGCAGNLTATAGIVGAASLNGGDPTLSAGVVPGIFPVRFGVAFVLSGTTTVDIPAATVGGAAYDGHAALACSNEADGVKTVASVEWGSQVGNPAGSLRITMTAATTADRTVSWFVPG